MNIFANQCSQRNNSSIRPSVLFERKENVISSIHFASDGIAKISQEVRSIQDSFSWNDEYLYA